jgi:hypothetical protein
MVCLTRIRYFYFYFYFFGIACLCSKFKLALNRAIVFAFQSTSSAVVVPGVLPIDQQSPGGSTTRGTSWPELLLPSEIPDARILTFGYDADIVHLT